MINQLLQRVMSAAGKKKKKKADEEAAEVTSYSLQQNSYLMASVTFVFMILNVRRRMRERCPSPRWICSGLAPWTAPTSSATTSRYVYCLIMPRYVLICLDISTWYATMCRISSSVVDTASHGPRRKQRRNVGRRDKIGRRQIFPFSALIDKRYIFIALW